MAFQIKDIYKGLCAIISLDLFNTRPVTIEIVIPALFHNDIEELREVEEISVKGKNLFVFNILKDFPVDKGITKENYKDKYFEFDQEYHYPNSKGSFKIYYRVLKNE